MSVKTRERLIDACVGLLSTGSSDWARRSLTVDEIVAGAGVARRTFYLHFETLDDLLAAAAELLSAPSLPPIGVLTTAGDVGDLLDVIADPAELRRRAAGVMLGPLLGRTALGREATVEWFEQLVFAMAELGRTPRPPLTPPALAAQAAALLDGLAISAPAAAREMLAVALATSTAPARTDVAADDAVARFIEDLDRGAALKDAAEQFPALVRLVRDTALATFDEVGYAEATMDEVARRCGLSADALSRLYGTKGELAESIIVEIAADLALRSPGIAGLELANAVVDAVKRHPSLGELLSLQTMTQAFVTTIVGAGTEMEPDALAWQAEVILPAVARLAAAGRDADDPAIARLYGVV